MNREKMQQGAFFHQRRFSMTRLSVIVIAAAFIAGSVYAAEKPAAPPIDNGKSTVVKTETEAPEVETEGTVADTVKPSKIAKEFGLTVDAVEKLKETYKIGYGGIEIALKLAQKSGKTVDEILLMKTQDNLGWGVIEKQLSVKANSDKTAPEINSEKSIEAKQTAMEKKAEHQAEKAEKKEPKIKP